MKRRPLSLMGATRNERHQVIADVGEAIATAGGWIVDHALFSNVAVTIRLVLSPKRLGELQRLIAAAGVRLDDASLAEISQAMSVAGGEDDEIAASMNVTFVHDEPDLRREVPPIPG